MRVVVTGASGVLGQELIKRLHLEHGVSTLSISRNLERSIFDHDTCCTTRELFENASLIGSNDILVNCAFPRTTEGNALACGLDFTAKLFDIASRRRVKAVINVSSQSVYDPSRTSPASEKAPIVLKGEYAVAKYAAEKLCSSVFSSIPYSNIRLASLIGPLYKQRMVNKMLDQALSKGRLSLVESSSRYGLLDVADAAVGLAAIATSVPESWNHVYNLGIEGGYSLNDIGTEVARYAKTHQGVSVSIVASGNEGRFTNSEMSCDLFRRQFSWSPVLSLSDSLDRMVVDAL